ncbi:preprotein translocase subunit YajC [Streptomyces sulfonofaciens]|uniref:Preprotein translocase subunit YajC n=1 Tax=Streptomyces sulfonofaciens TaxID=68272 RepID=A0A919G1E8_9ACTN|nr:preprotein translocase subunit YajC [Streptomyces sulfonofaciens]GHH75691.1 preprotein translocase subunit YajC [Streptomyces sulfonofaciens]
MSLVTLLPFIVLIGAMFLMTRSAKRKQSQAAQMRDHMQPGSGVRTIGGMYATVKEVHEETVLLEVDAGTHAIFAKNAIGAVLDDEEYNRIVHGAGDAIDLDTPIVPDDASSLTETEETDETADSSDGSPVDLGKRDTAGEKPAGPAKTTASGEGDARDADEKAAAGDAAEAKDATKVDAGADDAEPKKTDGESEAK